MLATQSSDRWLIVLEMRGTAQMAHLLTKDVIALAVSDLKPENYHLNSLHSSQLSSSAMAAGTEHPEGEGPDDVLAPIRDVLACGHATAESNRNLVGLLNSAACELYRSPAVLELHEPGGRDKATARLLDALTMMEELEEYEDPRPKQPAGGSAGTLLQCLRVMQEQVCILSLVCAAYKRAAAQCCSNSAGASSIASPPPSRVQVFRRCFDVCQ